MNENAVPASGDMDVDGMHGGTWPCGIHKGTLPSEHCKCDGCNAVVMIVEVEALEGGRASQRGYAQARTEFLGEGEPQFRWRFLSA